MKKNILSGSLFFLRDILKNGNIDGFWSGVYAEKFPSKNAEVVKLLKDSEVEK
jgi:hypothetical protein